MRLWLRRSLNVGFLTPVRRLSCVPPGFLCFWETLLSDSLTSVAISVCMCVCRGCGVGGGGGGGPPPPPVLAAEDTELIKTDLVTIICGPWSIETVCTPSSHAYRWCLAGAEEQPLPSDGTLPQTSIFPDIPQFET